MKDEDGFTNTRLVILEERWWQRWTGEERLWNEAEHHEWVSGGVGEGRGGRGGVGGPVFVALSGQGRTGQQVSRATPRDSLRPSTPPLPFPRLSLPPPRPQMRSYVTVTR
ncbi:hypothetical protein E2C01_017599 [Portunus trituberculatus]|uniref:Uncharacterized protein n=1 Tax=Portunus trituberculatus TaxID=210409 RepID=A0A5B7DTY3_PORTR|nr:hypothetical protein [Portunus trituberculatus]